MRIFDRTFAITYALEVVAVLVAVMGIAGALIALVIDHAGGSWDCCGSWARLRGRFER